jgi:hypothetical protein
MHGNRTRLFSFFFFQNKESKLKNTFKMSVGKTVKRSPFGRYRHEDTAHAIEGGGGGELE